MRRVSAIRRGLLPGLGPRVIRCSVDRFSTISTRSLRRDGRHPHRPLALGGTVLRYVIAGQHGGGRWPRPAKLNGARTKPAKEVNPGDMLTIRLKVAARVVITARPRRGPANAERAFSAPSGRKTARPRCRSRTVRSQNREHRHSTASPPPVLRVGEICGLSVMSHRSSPGGGSVGRFRGGAARALRPLEEGQDLLVGPAPVAELRPHVSHRDRAPRRCVDIVRSFQQVPFIEGIDGRFGAP